MTYYNQQELIKLDKLFRGNLINSCTGYKSANLIATKSVAGIENVAVFNSVSHIGSNPPILSILFRPTTVSRNTYTNIKDTGIFSINSISEDFIKQAHHTAAKYDDTISEFDKSNLTQEYRDGFEAPFVQNSIIQLGCRYLNEYVIKENDTILVLGSIEHLYLKENIILEDGWLDLEKANSIAITGLDAYSKPKLIDRFNYARPEQEVKSIKK
ncbi:NADH-FMN oxidoreductase RutF, flavin reductase (DIM6/NTAB) family [Gillisia sp. Hel1_33_143]|uniref:flavin reductase family protein n=1 Tax=Gillisia sp. Hel1_33_143 TaxID=1336796 RepID=UPI000879E44D|nr:flavin reductase [Gillisia sp. Hel1_33_143]SDR66829.1 NADH-FMN oxidoreductase RutF, flavin reductase (DIM6/NTAB) family [Gillisia sp. Hel1_33_143]